AIDAITDTHKLGLEKYELEKYEWALVKQMCDVLKILKDTTLYFSHSMLNLAMVIPAMDHIDSIITNGVIKRDTLDPGIHATLGLAKCTLNHYYSLTDTSKFCGLTLLLLVLHPHHKLSYFKSTGWEEEWIKTAETFVHTEYQQSYA
ncbi:hypothetical protein BDR07DRAFT_1215261, partial [Suillus spraguei]